jgi:hypothetical protein
MLPKRTCLGELEIIEVFDFFDFPRLFSCHNKTGQIFFALSVEDDIDKAMFIYAPISLGRYRLLVSGSLSIRDAIRLAEDSFVFNVEFTSSGETAEMISCSEIPDVWLPEESEAIISSESAIPYQNVQSATDYAYSTLRETINFVLKLPKNSTQVAARILGDFLGSFQELIDAIAQACLGEPTLRGSIQKSILDMSNFYVSNTYQSSFGIQLIADKQVDLFSDSLAGDAVEELFKLINAKADEILLREILQTLKGRAASKYRSFLEALLVTEGDLEFSWGSPKATRGGESLMSKQDMQAAYHIVSMLEQEVGEQIQIQCTLFNLHVRTRSFEIRDLKDGKIYAGKLSEEAPERINHATLSENYSATLRRVIEVKSVSGEEKDKWLLMDLVSISSL